MVQEFKGLTVLEYKG